MRYRCNISAAYLTLHRKLFPMLVVCLLALIGLMISGCKKTPDYVLDREEMAQLMADIHTGEAVIDFNYSVFPNDSTRKMLKQSIYASHGVTAEQVDTSYVWYGNNIEEYIKVYDRTIEILHQRQGEFMSANSAQIAIAGDSVAVWRGPERILVNSKMPSRVLTFAVSPDSTWKAGDIYTLHYKPINAQNDVTARLLVEYAGGLIRYTDKPVSTRFPHRLQIQVDSTETPLRVYGYLLFHPEKNSAFEVDSIALTRQRKELLPGFRTRPEEFKISNTYALNDSVDVDDKDTDKESTTSARRPQSTHHSRPLASEVDAPESSSASSHSEHRQGALQHKPTATQRREAQQRHRTAQPIKKNTNSGAQPAKARIVKK